MTLPGSDGSRAHGDGTLTPDRALRALVADDLPPGLVAHIDRVVEVAERLARRHGLDVALVRLMAQAHDVLRAVPPADLLRRSEQAGLAMDPVERAEPVLLHGPLAAAELESRYGVTDGRVRHAVHWHTTGHPDYGLEAWAMFVADKVEPDKVARWPALERVATLAGHSLEGAALAYLDLLLARALDERWLIHPASVLARNALVARGITITG